jgi:hypothetical protein
MFFLTAVFGGPYLSDKEFFKMQKKKHSLAVKTGLVFFVLFCIAGTQVFAGGKTDAPSDPNAPAKLRIEWF